MNETLVGRGVSSRRYGSAYPIWTQTDGTERGMAPALIRGGISPERIILAFSSEGPYPYSDILAA